jgi:hypothetical protein
MSAVTPDRTIPLPTWLCAGSPFVLALAYVTLGVHIRLGLGHWPQPYTEEYASLAFRIHENVLALVLLFTVYAAAPLWGVFLCFRWLRLGWRTHIRQALAFVVGWIALLVAGALDPTTFTEWLLD